MGDRRRPERVRERRRDQQADLRHGREDRRARRRKRPVGDQAHRQARQVTRTRSQRPPATSRGLFRWGCRKINAMKVIGMAGYSGSGKTTLIEKVIPVLVRQGLRVSLIKHAHHEFDVDQPGKDSYRHRHAGCAEVLVSSSKRWALMHELRGVAEPGLDEQLKQLSPCDLVIVEGYKSEPIPKVEVHRRAGHTPLLYPDDPHIVAIATDEPLDTSLPQLEIEDPEAVARFIIQHLGLNRARLVR
ncbi:MAG: molybdopterin-guanine dinucleotide biosynthesis protein B [Usitatibacter sp.]